MTEGIPVERHVRADSGAIVALVVDRFWQWPKATQLHRFVAWHVGDDVPCVHGHGGPHGSPHTSVDAAEACALEQWGAA